MQPPFSGYQDVEFYMPSELHTMPSQQTVIFLPAAGRTSDLTFVLISVQTNSFAICWQLMVSVFLHNIFKLSLLILLV